MNTDRAVGTRLAGDIARRQRAEGKIQPVELNYKGAAGQSFMAFAVSEMKVSLEGDANDYVCKGLSARTCRSTRRARPRRTGCLRPRTVSSSATRVLYGATSASSSRLGSRAIGSVSATHGGVQAVIEGAGDHCCEYMTNGVVLVLGPTGINVGSGMTGGVAYLYDPSVNDDMIAVDSSSASVKPRRVQNGSPAADTIKRLLSEHHEATASKHAKHLLETFDASHFCQVVPPSEEDKPHHAVR